MPQKIRVGILFGGKSVEHEVSLASAASVIEAIDQEKYEVVLIGITKDGQWRLGQDATKLIPEQVFKTGRRILVPPDPAVYHFLPIPESDESRNNRNSLAPSFAQKAPESGSNFNLSRVDVVFPILHGRFGEDGTIQGLLELAGIPYVSGGVLASAVGMDKGVMKRLFREAGLPVVKFITFTERALKMSRTVIRKEVARKLRFPCFVKPANSGSSVGIRKVPNPSELDAAIDNALQFDEKILVEEGIDGRELECSVLGNEEPRASLPGEVIPAHEFYDYDAKYIDERSRLVIPAKLSQRQTTRIQELAVLAFKAIDGAGMARVDFFLEKKTSRIIVNEINTIPGFTKISMYPKLWEASGISYSELIDRLIQLALERNIKRSRLKISYEG